MPFRSVGQTGRRRAWAWHVGALLLVLASGCGPGGVQELFVDPDANDAEVLKAIGSAAEGRDIIFYCSVGVRSTILAQRVHAALAKNGAGAIANLSGGIFAWHNAGRRLVGMDGKTTDLVHPFDGEWGRLVKRQDRVSYRPGSPEVNAMR